MSELKPQSHSGTILNRTNTNIEGSKCSTVCVRIFKLADSAFWLKTKIILSYGTNLTSDLVFPGNSILNQLKVLVLKVAYHGPVLNYLIDD